MNGQRHCETHTHTHTHTHTEYNSAIKKNEILPLATRMDLEGIILSEVSQSKYQVISLT